MKKSKETMMWERLRQEFPSLSGVKVTPYKNVDIATCKVLQCYYDNLEKNLRIFIEKEKELSFQEGLRSNNKKGEAWRRGFMAASKEIAEMLREEEDKFLQGFAYKQKNAKEKN